MLKQFVERGWTCVPRVLELDAVQALRHAVSDITWRSRGAREDTEAVDFAEQQQCQQPRQLRKIKRPHLWHSAFNNMVEHPQLLAIVDELLNSSNNSNTNNNTQEKRCRGLRFHGDKVVIKPPQGAGQPVVCHQDWAFYPHTNDSMVTVSVVLQDMTLEGGGLLFVSGSHQGPAYSHHCPTSGAFLGGIADARFQPDQVPWQAVACPAGSLVVHHVRTVHASPINQSPHERPLLLLQYAAADAWPLLQHPRGAWGIDPPPGSSLDEQTLFQRGLVGAECSCRDGRQRHCACMRMPRLEQCPVSMPIPWPGRGSKGSLYRQLAQVRELDVEAAAIETVEYKSPSPPVAAQENFATLFCRRHACREGQLEWSRLLQFVRGGPYGSLRSMPDAGAKLESVCVGAVEEGGGSDEEVYDALSACFWEDVVPTLEPSTQPEDRTVLRAAEVAELARSGGGADPTPTSMLDIGCADGRITARIGTALGLEPGNVHGCDTRAAMVAYAEGADEDHLDKFVFTETAEPSTSVMGVAGGAALLPYEDSSFELVTCLMTLHHLRLQKEYLDEVYRVLRPGGMLVVRDHDCRSSATATVLDIVHGMHYLVWPRPGHPNRRTAAWFAEHYEAYYQSQAACVRAATAAGLTPSTASRAASSEVHERSDGSVEFVDPKRVFFGVFVKQG